MLTFKKSVLLGAIALALCVFSTVQSVNLGNIKPLSGIGINASKNTLLIQDRNG